MNWGRALLKLDSRWWRERYSENLGREKEIKRFNKLGEGEKEGGAYHPSAVKGGTTGSGSFAVILSQ